jgi:hypothetical protein
MYRRWLWWLVGIAVVLTGLGFTLTCLPRFWAERLLAQQTGTKVSVGQVRVSWWGPRVWVRDIVLYNLPEFGATPALNIRELQAVLSWGDLLRGRSRVRRLQVEIALVAVVQAQDGRLNWQAIGGEPRRQQEGSGPLEPPEVASGHGLESSRSPRVATREARQHRDQAPESKPGSVNEPRLRATQVDELIVRLDRIEVARMGTGASVFRPRHLDVRITHVATNVTDVNDFAWEFSAALAVRALPLLASEAVSDAADRWAKSLESLVQTADQWLKEGVGDGAVSNLLQNLPAILPGVFR